MFFIVIRSNAGYNLENTQIKNDKNRIISRENKFTGQSPEKRKMKKPKCNTENWKMIQK